MMAQVDKMSIVLVAFLIVFVQVSADAAVCADLMSAKSDRNCQVQMSRLADSRCALDHCATRCQLAAQSKPFSVPKSAAKPLLDPTQIALALNPVVMESFFSTPFLWPGTEKEPSGFGVEVYLLNTSFLI